MADAQQATAGGGHAEDETRRDFLLMATAAFGAAGVGIAAWPFIHQMNPAKDTLAVATIEVDLAPIQVGQRITVTWRGKPVFIDHRTPEQIEAARQVDVSALRDPQPDSERVKEGQAEWLVVVGICTHLGCIPKGQRPGEPRGEWKGWFCPCHGSHYDTSGRVRRGPAPINLAVPDYEFIEANVIRIG